jgi:integrase
MDSRPGARRRGPIIVSGPLAPFAEGLRRDLAGRGYARDTVGDHVHLLVDLSDWLSGRGLAVADLATPVAEEFLRVRRAAGLRVGVTPRGLAPVLGYLRRLGVAAPAHAAAVPDTPVEILLAEYRRHLVGERGLSAGTATHYLRCAGNGEVARLQLADVDWRSGELRIRGKGGRVDALPLPADVGEALADYLLHARPATSSRCLFVTLVAPFTAIATSSVTVMVARACARAGVPRFGPHGMRHAAA